MKNQAKEIVTVINQSQPMGRLFQSTGLSLSFNSPVALIFTPIITNLSLYALGELYQIQASSPTRGHRACLAATGATGNSSIRPVEVNSFFPDRSATMVDNS